MEKLLILLVEIEDYNEFDIELMIFKKKDKFEDLIIIEEVIVLGNKRYLFLVLLEVIVYEWLKFC